MAYIRETDLAGIGRRFTVETRAKDRLIIVVRDDGNVELYHAPTGDPDEAVAIATLDDDEARRVAAIIGKTFFRPEAIERLNQHGIVIVWRRLGESAYAVGKTLEELQATQRTGASIIAVVEKEGNKRTNPDMTYTLREGSQVALSGTQKQVDACAELLEKGAGA